MAIDVYKIEWSKPFPYEQAVSRPEASQHGIYAIYNTTKGKKTLVYIGKSQELRKRITQHQQGINRFSKKEYTYSLGTIYPLSGKTSTGITPKQLREIESFFINKYKPSGNDISTKKGYKGTSLIVINIGKLICFNKVDAHNEDLLKLLKNNLVTKKSTSSSDWW